MNTFNTLESQNLDLIDLDKLNELSKYVDQEQGTKMTRQMKWLKILMMM